MAVSSRARGAVVWEPIRVSTPTRVKTRVTPRSRPATKSREGARRTRMRGSTGNIARSSSRISGMTSFFMAAVSLRTTAHARQTRRGSDPPIPRDDKVVAREGRNKTIRTGRARFRGHRPGEVLKKSRTAVAQSRVACEKCDSARTLRKKRAKKVHERRECLSNNERALTAPPPSPRRFPGHLPRLRPPLRRGLPPTPRTPPARAPWLTSPPRRWMS